MKLDINWISADEETPPEGLKILFQTSGYLAFPDNVLTGVRRGDWICHSQRYPFDDYREELKRVTKWILI